MNRCGRAVLLLLLVLLSIASGDGARAQRCQPTRRAELVVMPLGNIPIVTAHINGGTADFLFDTGAERSIMTAAAAKRLGVAAHFEYARRMRSLGTAVAGGDARLSSFNLGGMPLSNFSILVGAVALPPIGGKPIDGLLGADFLGDYEVELDLPHRRITLFTPPPCPMTAPPWRGSYATIDANRSLHDRLFFPVRLDGHQLSALIDTGAQLTTLDAEFGCRCRRDRRRLGARSGHHLARRRGGTGQLTGPSLCRTADRRRGAARPNHPGDPVGTTGR